MLYVKNIKVTMIKQWIKIIHSSDDRLICWCYALCLSHKLAKNHETKCRLITWAPAGGNKSWCSPPAPWKIKKKFLYVVGLFWACPSYQIFCEHPWLINQQSITYLSYGGFELRTMGSVAKRCEASTITPKFV